MQKLFLVALVVSLTACVQSFGRDRPTIVPVTPQTALAAEEYAVYNALITALYIGDKTQLIVIQDHTGTGPGDDLDGRLEYVQKNLPDLTQEIIADFRAKNQESHPLKPMFRLGVEYVLISREETGKIFEGTLFDSSGGWGRFYRKYPGSQGDMTLSRVGFNANVDMALVYAGNRYAELAGSGHFFLMAKENGAWRISDAVMVWIS